MGNYMVKPPTVSELRTATAVTPHGNIPEPTTWFNLPLRPVLLVILAAYTILGLVNLGMSFSLIVNPLLWIYIIFDIIGLCLDIFGFLAIFRLVPEWMAAYAWALLVLFGVSVIEFITWTILGGFFRSVITLAFQAFFTFTMLACIYAMRAYALACKGIV
ncbi:hypothetical protein BC830DRAFT_709595 [Chytriomyces sp. MP71]|nr:hypothetical protein BC830DRAFT_709595 [Chytriomyces sp. MP71]